VPHFAVSAIGRDRPGIVAAISKVLLNTDGNIEDSQMSILRGHFAVMLIVALPEGTARDDLERRLGDVRDKLELEAIAVSPVDELGGARPEATHVLTVYGADHPGIVHAATSALAERGITITDLTTKLAGTGDPPLYALMMEIAPPAGADEGELSEALSRVGAEQGVEVSLRQLEAEAL
jgi:glycine cleavage system transcriptional repressor